MPQSRVIACLLNTFPLIFLFSFAGPYYSEVATQYLEALPQRGYLFMERRANYTLENRFASHLCILALWNQASLFFKLFYTWQSDLHFGSYFFKLNPLAKASTLWAQGKREDIQRWQKDSFHFSFYCSILTLIELKRLKHWMNSSKLKAFLLLLVKGIDTLFLFHHDKVTAWAKADLRHLFLNKGLDFLNNYSFQKLFANSYSLLTSYCYV